MLEAQIKGIAEDDEYNIEIESKKTETILANTKYIYDSTLAEDQEIIKAYRSKWSKKYDI